MPDECKHENQEQSYGLAGGGIGAYTYCCDCGVIINKVQDQEMLTSSSGVSQDD